MGNELDVQGEYLLQFGNYRGQSFRWMLENALGYVGWFVDNIRNEKVTNSPISQNKAAFKKYVESFPEGCEVVAFKKKQREDKEAKIQASRIAVQSSAPKPAVSSLAAGLESGQISTERYLSKVKTSPAAAKFKPTIPPQRRLRKPVTPSATVTTAAAAATSADDDHELCAFAEEMERNLGIILELRDEYVSYCGHPFYFIIFILSTDPPAPEQQVPQPQAPEPVAVPEPEQVPTTSMAQTSSVRNQGKVYFITIISKCFLLIDNIQKILPHSCSFAYFVFQF